MSTENIVTENELKFTLISETAVIKRSNQMHSKDVLFSNPKGEKFKIEIVGERADLNKWTPDGWENIVRRSVKHNYYIDMSAAAFSQNMFDSILDDYKRIAKHFS